jgi:hypothetical protein
MIVEHWGVGDTRSALAVTLKRDGSVIDLTGKTVTFSMEDDRGIEVVAETGTGIQVTDAVNGACDFSFSAPAVANRGNFYCYFYVADTPGGKQDTWPPEGLLLIVGDRGKDRTIPTTIDILTAAQNPIRIRTDEGTVEERPIDDLIKADRYLASKQAQSASPFGLRIARMQPPGTT